MDIKDCNTVKTWSGGYTISVCNQSIRPTQPCIPPGSQTKYQLHLGKGTNVTSARWQVTLCDHIWHVSNHSSVAGCNILQTAKLCLLTLQSV